MGICNFCGEDKKLIKAHIIPEAFWEIDNTVTVPMKIMSNTKGTFPKKSRVGIYDPNILCAECDQWIGREFDEYAYKELLQKGPDELIMKHGAIVGSLYKKRDKYRLKRFFISVMWRAHLSTRPEFSWVLLGPYANLARKALKDDTILERFDICIAEFSEGYRGWLDPRMTKFEGVNTLLFYINRFMAYIKLDKRTFATPLKSNSMNNRDDIISISRKFNDSKEKKLMTKIVKKNPRAFG